MKTFYTVWAGQLASNFGSQLTAFAIGLWLYQKSGSTTLYSLYLACTFLPSVLLSPFLGALADRFDRRKLMIVADVGAGSLTLVLAMCLHLDMLEYWLLFTLVPLKAVFAAALMPTYAASTSLLVPKEKLGKAAGLVQLSFGVAQILAPALGAVLILTIGLEGIILIDAVSFILAVATLLLVRFPQVPKSSQGQSNKVSIFKDVAFGFSYLKARRGLLGLLFFLAGFNFFVGIVYALATPAILLSFNNDTVLLGTLLSVAGVGMLCGSVLMSAWGGPKQLIKGVLSFSLLTAVAIFCAGLEPSEPVVLGFFVFLVLFGSPLVAGCNQAIWQRKVAFDLQGKVFGVRQMVATSSVPLAYLVAGPLADKVFEPFMASNHSLVSMVENITGAGPGAGIRLIFLMMGLGMLLMVLWAYRSKHMRFVQERLPDADQMVVSQAV